MFSVKQAQIFEFIFLFSLCLVVTTFPRNHFMISTIILLFPVFFFNFFFSVFTTGVVAAIAKIPLNFFSSFAKFYFVKFFYFPFFFLFASKVLFFTTKKRKKKNKYCNIKKNVQQELDGNSTAAFNGKVSRGKLCNYFKLIVLFFCCLLLLTTHNLLSNYIC